MTNQRKIQKNATRERLKKIAQALFESQGIEATNTRSISKAANVAVGTFFSHYPDKLSLVKELFFETLDHALENAADHYQETPHPVHYFEYFACVLLEVYANHNESARMVLLDSIIQGGHYSHQVKVLYTRSVDKYVKVGVNEEVAQVFAENMCANFLQVTMSLLAAQPVPIDKAKQKLTTLNRPFSASYQSALAAHQKHRT